MRIAVVTGASSGIGKEFVHQIPLVYNQLDEIWVIARRKDRLEEIKKSCEMPIRIISGDLQEQNVYSLLKTELRVNNADIRMLVNAAGFGKFGKFTDLDQEEQLSMVELNCTALTKMIIICLPFMNKGSRIIQLSSAASFSPQPYFAVYAATKAYVQSFSIALREELKSRMIIVTSVCPGPVKTEFFDIAGPAEHLTKSSIMTSARSVVSSALIASINKKAVCVCGPYMKAMRIMTKLVPAGTAAWIMYKTNK